MNKFFEKIEYTEEVKKPRINIQEIIKSAALILQIKKNKTEEETIMVVSRSKHAAFNARISFMKRNRQTDKIDLFDLAGESKKRLTVFQRGEKYERYGRMNS